MYSLSAQANPAIDQFCASEKPVYIIDEFHSPQVDVNGDGQPDVSHGKLVQTLYQAQGRDTLTAGVSLGRGSTNEQMAKALSTAAQKISSGEVDVAAINISMTRVSTFTELNQNLKLSAEVTKDNLHQHREEILKRIVEQEPSIKPVIDGFAKLQQLGVPVLLSSGNEGQEGYYSVLSLMPGTVTIGALDLNGQPTPYSVNHSLVVAHSQGDYSERLLADGGVDLTGDGVAEFSKDELTSDPALKRSFDGTSVNQSVATVPPQVAILASRMPPQRRYRHISVALAGKVYAITEIEQKLPFFPPSYIANLKRQGDYVTSQMTLIFRESGGNLVFDPDGSGATNQLGLLSGTSFAAMSICR
jgi:hypothetical protein